jgi:thiamine-monophosphate kinase
MIDLSDGLAGDLRHILKGQRRWRGIVENGDSHQPRGEIAGARLPNPGTSQNRVAAALTDGEDFELLFTVAAGDAVKLLDAWKKQFPKLKLSCIGKINRGRTGVTLRDKDGVQN